LFGVVSSTALCGSDFEIPIGGAHTSIDFDGYHIDSIKRFETTGQPKIVLKGFGAVPIHTTDGDSVSVQAGESCGPQHTPGDGPPPSHSGDGHGHSHSEDGKTNSTSADTGDVDVESPESGAISMFGGLSSVMMGMGYPMLSAAALLGANFLPVAFAAGHGDMSCPRVSVEIYMHGVKKAPAAANPCEGAKPAAGSGFDNFPCGDIYTMVNDVIEMRDAPQAGANVTAGYQGDLQSQQTPLTGAYYQHGLCPVNVHWHLGAEHYSVGEFDETGAGPTDIHHRRRLAGKTRQGFQCTHYDGSDPKFTTPYDWKHCDSTMEVGQTYEVHWPHSAFGACGTPDQYQYPFYDGVFCHIGTRYNTEKQLSHQVGVQGQIFTIVNDDDYYYPDMIRGMIIDGDYGQDIAAYTGSTTGTTRSNTVCSAYSPITWQVDRKCHLISASSFDKMCADMKAQRDDMSDDLYAHGARELVNSTYAGDNHADYVAPP
jgi:hypothetical protein